MTISSTAHSESKPSAQIDIYFPSDYDPRKYKFIQVPKELEASFLGQSETDSELTIRGLESDHLVLCTSTKTYSLKQVHTSNSILLLQHSHATSSSALDLDLDTDQMEMDVDLEDDKDEDENVDKTVYFLRDNISCVLELAEHSPDLDRLRELLSSSVYDGEEKERSVDTTKLCTFRDFQDSIQMSDFEIKQSLQQLNAVNINGYYRVLSPFYIHETLNFISTVATAEDWSMNFLSENNMVESLKDFDVLDDVTRHCLIVFSESCIEKDDDKVYSLSRVKVSRFMAQQVFAMAETGMNWKLEDFQSLWRQLLPEQFETVLDDLKGLTLQSTDPLTTQHYISYLPIHELPISPAERFKKLFEIKEKWTKDELIPYLDGLPGLTSGTGTGSGSKSGAAANLKKVDALLLKWCRSLKEKGKMVYISREKKQ
ncbi:sister chromatid cohesion protein Dcc1 [Paraphysoderma sedebokerense]|nr:sister chromatid cohesion protein Dcc1 [Paraphysoderma sedebokerense]